MRLNKVLDSNKIPRLKTEAKIPLPKNTTDGLKRSAIVRKAKSKVPEMNPN